MPGGRRFQRGAPPPRRRSSGWGSADHWPGRVFRAPRECWPVRAAESPVRANRRPRARAPLRERAGRPIAGAGGDRMPSRRYLSRPRAARSGFRHPDSGRPRLTAAALSRWTGLLRPGRLGIGRGSYCVMLARCGRSAQVSSASPAAAAREGTTASGWPATTGPAFPRLTSMKRCRAGSCVARCYRA